MVIGTVYPWSWVRYTHGCGYGIPTVVGTVYLRSWVRYTYGRRYGIPMVAGTVYLWSQVRYTYGHGYGIPLVVGTVYPWDKLFGRLLIKKGQGRASERRAFLAESTEGANGRLFTPTALSIFLTANPCNIYIFSLIFRPIPLYLHAINPLTQRTC